MTHRGGKRPRLTLCAIAFDEEELIRGCLESVRGLVDEIVLGLDTRTTDRTAKIARGHGARIIPIDWRDDFSYARNVTLEAARGDWLLVLDADDRLTADGARAVRSVLDKADAGACAEQVADLAAAHSITLAVDRIDGFMFEIAEHTLDGSHINTWLGSNRLFRREAGIRYRGRVHEDPQRPGTTDDEGTLWAVLPGGPHIRHLGYDPLHFERRGKADRNLRLAQLRVADEPDNFIAHYQLVRAAESARDMKLARQHANRALELAPGDTQEAGCLRAFLMFGTADWLAGFSSGPEVDREAQVRLITKAPTGPLELRL